MLTKNEQKTIERLATMMQRMDEMQKAQLCAFAEGLAMALEHSKRVVRRAQFIRLEVRTWILWSFTGRCERTAKKKRRTAQSAACAFSATRRHVK